MMMTAKEFAAKYGLDYQYVYNATWRVERKEVSPMRYRYDEQELMKAVRGMLEVRVEKAEIELKRAKEMLAKTQI